MPTASIQVAAWFDFGFGGGVCVCVSVYAGFCAVSMGGWFGLLVACACVFVFVYLCVGSRNLLGTFDCTFASE